MGERGVVGVDGAALMAGMGEDASEVLVVAGAKEDAEGDGGTTTRRVGAEQLFALCDSCTLLRGVSVADREEVYADPRCSASCHGKIIHQYKKDSGRLWKGTHDSHRGRAWYWSPPTLICLKFHNCVLRRKKRLVITRSSVLAERAR